MKFGDYLKAKREERGLTIEQFAERCGISPIYVADLEQGKTDTYAEGLYYKMAGILGLDGDEFIIKSCRIPKWAYKYILKNWPQVKVSLIKN